MFQGLLETQQYMLLLCRGRKKRKGRKKKYAPIMLRKKKGKEEKNAPIMLRRKKRKSRKKLCSHYAEEEKKIMPSENIIKHLLSERLRLSA